MLAERGSLTVAEIAEALRVSAMTVRRDLDELSTAGLLRRQHGGATQNIGRAYEPPFRLRADRQTADKESIGKAAAAMVRPGDAIGFDVGSTALSVAEALETTNITVVTASLRVATTIASRFALERDLRVVLIGGVLRSDELSLVGGMADAALSGLRLDRAFIGVGGLSVSEGATEFSMEDALVKRRLVQISDKVVVVADHTKFGEVALCHVCATTEIDTIVTDAAAPEDDVRALRDLGVEVEQAG